MILEATNLTFSYGASPVVKDVSLQIEAGERLAIIGPNGSGKSTLLKLLSGFLQPDSGEIRLGNTPLKELTELERGRTLGYLPQQVSTFFPFTAGEMVQMAMSVHSGGFFDGRRERSRAVQALKRVNMESLFDQPFTQMSGGEQKLTLMARLLAQSSTFMLLDEPIASLDLGHAQVVLGLLNQEAKEGRGVVGVMHNLNLALSWFDRFLLMNKGQCVVSGDREALLEPGRLEAVYVTEFHRIEHPVSGRTYLLTEDKG